MDNELSQTVAAQKKILESWNYKKIHCCFSCKNSELDRDGTLTCEPLRQGVNRVEVGYNCLCDKFKNIDS